MHNEVQALRKWCQEILLCLFLGNVVLAINAQQTVRLRNILDVVCWDHGVVLEIFLCFLEVNTLVSYREV